MRIIVVAILSFFFLNNCSKMKTVFICGDHVCINKKEAEQYFEENLSIEVKVIDNNKKKEIDLIELNLKKKSKGERNVSYVSKKSSNKNLKTLSSEEVKAIKKKINNKKRKKTIAKRIENKKDETKSLKTKKIKKKITKVNNSVSKLNQSNLDVCTILETCSIDEISKYLLKQGMTKGFPDITARQ